MTINRFNTLLAALFYVTAVVSVAKAETYVAYGTDCKSGFSTVYSGYLQTEVKNAVYTCGGMGACDMGQIASINTSGCAPAGSAQYSSSLVIACKLCKRD